MPDSEKRPQYRVYLNDELLTVTDWPPMAVAAWNRATRDIRAGGGVQLEKDGRIIASASNGGHYSKPWPDGREPDLNDLAAAILLLARTAGVDIRALADSMTAQGLPTTRGRLDSIRARSKPDQSQTSAAELITLCYGAIGAIRSKQDGAIKP